MGLPQPKAQEIAMQTIRPIRILTVTALLTATVACYAGQSHRACASQWPPVATDAVIGTDCKGPPAPQVNPQPLPPRHDDAEVAINPQPLPPRHGGTAVAINPQPLPPRHGGVAVAINPQPLPPRWGRA
jgi:hypothetical protein